MFENMESITLEEKASYLKEGAYLVKVKSVKNSENESKKPKIPYIEFIAEAGNGSIARLKFLGNDEKTSPQAKEIRLKIFKQFLYNCGVRDFSNWVSAVKQAIGQKVNVCLSKREYWTNNIDGKPVIKHVVEYKFSNPENKPISFDIKYNKGLSQEDMRAYNEACKFANSSDSAAPNDLPF